MNRNRAILITLVLVSATALAVAATPQGAQPESARRLVSDSGGTATVVNRPATGVPRLVRFEPSTLALSGETLRQRADDFLARYAKAFGIDDPVGELVEVSYSTDQLGHTHLVLEQRRKDVPVYGGTLRLHFDEAGELHAVNGSTVPVAADLNTSPSITPSAAEEIARATSRTQGAPAIVAELEAIGTTLVVFRSGLAAGVPGRDHLVWQTEITDHGSLDELVFVDAHSGLVVDRVSLIHDVNRRIYERNNNTLIWSEGDPLPYTGSGDVADVEINGLIDFASHTYDLFLNLSGGTYPSYDAREGVMHSIYDDENTDCPNAWSSGPWTGFCPGTTADDVVAHEWAHSYTRANHDLIYAWQPGALNESYSDIYGELVDLINGAGTDEPGALRTPYACSVYAGGEKARFNVDSPAAIAGEYNAAGGRFNPPPPWSVEGELELVNDGVGNPHDGCQPPVDFTPGKIALLEFSTCLFQWPAGNAEAAGAIATVIINVNGDDVTNMYGDGNLLSIPSVLIGKSTGESIMGALSEGVEVTLASATDDSMRWLIGEDAPAFRDPLRDMWNPGCVGDPGKVSDSRYHCSESDGGGVHTNSGVPNHAFALLMDGGEYNGHTVAGIGMTRAARIYWRAMTVYQHRFSDFADHAEAIELSCQDLIGAELFDLETGEASNEVIVANDCAQVAAAMAAVEMRLDPDQCDFKLLDPEAPPAPGDYLVYSETFDSDPSGTWTFSHEGVHPEFTTRDWVWTTDVPEGGDSSAMYAINAPLGHGDCVAEENIGVLHLDSPQISLPQGARPVLVFDHYVATENKYDGGILMISVNGGPFEVIDSSAFLFNPYTRTLYTTNDPEEPNSNPLAGQRAFSGTDGGGSTTGSWGQSQADLSDYATAGDTIQIRFTFGVDSCLGIDGWYLNDMRLVIGPAVRSGGDRVGGGG